MLSMTSDSLSLSFLNRVIFFSLFNPLASAVIRNPQPGDMHETIILAQAHLNYQAQGPYP